MKVNEVVLCVIVATATSILHSCAAQTPLSVVDNGYLEKIFKLLSQLESKIDQCAASVYEYTVEANNDFSFFDIRVDDFPQKCQNNTLPKDCAEATACTNRTGVYKLLLEQYSPEPFYVKCDTQTDNGGWTLIQKRLDGSEDFYRNWNDYKNGFGNVDGEFFIGLDKLNALTNYNGPQELLVLLQDKGETREAYYNNFVVGGANESYALKQVGNYTGTAGDSLRYHLGAKFSTNDVNNSAEKRNCAILYTGAWWYKACHKSNLNGKYGDTKYGKGVNWFTFRDYYASIQRVTMMIRKRK